LYSDLAEVIIAKKSGVQAHPLARSFPTIEEGAQGVKFVQAALKSSNNEGEWIAL
jgi:hypothetical protein